MRRTTRSGFRRAAGKLAPLLVLLLFVGCQAPAPAPEPEPEPDDVKAGAERKVELVEVARSDRQWTGVAVSRTGRIFVNFPRWSQDTGVSVGELDADGSILPFPSESWNRFAPTDSLGANRFLPFPSESWNRFAPSESVLDQFVCVQSVFVDATNTLWILDPASPRFEGVVPGAAKLLRVDLASNRVTRIYRFDERSAPVDSYLNDVRVDAARGVAYITDSGRGGLVVLDLVTGASRRVLEDHRSTRSEGVLLVIGGRSWRRDDGGVPQVHADGLALTADGESLFYQALTGRTLYRIPTAWLRDPSLTDEQIASAVIRVARAGSCDGMLLGPDGRLYRTALEKDAIESLDPARPRLRTDVTDRRLAWPDSLAAGPDGSIYVTTAQIHRGLPAPEPYRLFRFQPLP